MAISFGPKLGLINNANIGENYVDAFRQFLQALDQLVMGSVINSTTIVPPSAPADGDSYLLPSAGSGAWSTFPAQSIAVWTTQVTNSGTNNRAPAWVNYVPNAGWIIWDTSQTGLFVFNGTNWGSIGGGGGGANFPVNTDITAMTGIPSTNLDGTGYQYNGGNPGAETNISATGIQFGSGVFGSGTETLVQISNKMWTGIGYTGYGLGVSNGTGDTIIGAGTIGTQQISTINMNVINGLNAEDNLTVGPNGIKSFGANQTIPFGAQGVTTNQISILFTGAGNNLGLIAFGTSGTPYGVQSTAGAASGQYLQIMVNGSLRVVQLLSPS